MLVIYTVAVLRLGLQNDSLGHLQSRESRSIHRDNSRTSHTDGADSSSARHISQPGGDHDEPPRIRLVPYPDSTAVHFSAIEREVREGTVLELGRFTDKPLTPYRISFKSRVVSRGHAEIWTENGRFWLRDTGSQVGTFLNGVRLSRTGQASRQCMLHDGDLIQLGVDYQDASQGHAAHYRGSDLDVFQCVKIRVELNRPAEREISAFSLQSYNSLQHLMAVLSDSDIPNCCICLYPIAPFQALFVAPCQHTLHFKCARPLLQHHPGFLCPVCREYADLESNVAMETEKVFALLGKSTGSSTCLQTEA